jgi:uncharacterized hydrophobic protein (TIGR00271 family)
MNSARIRYLLKKLKEYLAFKTEMVNHQGVIREVAGGVERSWIYYLMLLTAGLIALLGLLTNSVAVVIGAMLISPLMTPIISSSLALTIGDLHLARRAFRTIAVSVFLTILVCALVTLISPLKEPTAEIMARVRPNIYDLFVAVLSGIVGAVALCTKRNYLITATGVAVATAVIPPLSVVGYGLGTGQVILALGGFLLFFTNFVAIVLTSDLVFFVMGFRTSYVETIQYSPRRRLLIIAGLLLLISIPLVYTLVVDLKKVNTVKRIERVLKKHLNREDVSHLTGYAYQDRMGKLLIRATVNTISFIGEPIEKQMQTELTENLKTPVDLKLEQVLVASEKVSGEIVQSSLLPGIGVTTPRSDTPAEISAKVGRLVVQAENELKEAVAPFPVADTRLSFTGGAGRVQVSATLRRDYPVGDDERLVLSRLLQRTLELPVDLSVDVSPLLPKLEFAADGSLAPGSMTALAIVKQLPGGPGGFSFLLESSGRKNSRELAGVKRYLTQQLGVPEEAVHLERSRKRPKRSAEVTLWIVRNKEGT